MNKIVFTLLMLQISILAISQNEPVKLQKDPLEQVILHTDRDLYLAGEKIWFNASVYITDEAAEHNMSNVLYIELFNNKRVYLSKKKFKILDGIAYGSIDIPEIFVSDNYFLRAYTQFQKN